MAGRRAPKDWKIADVLSEHIAVLDKSGRIVAVNAAWRRLATRRGGSFVDEAGVGADYLDACRNKAGIALPVAESVASSLQAVLEGRLERFSCEYSCRVQGLERWFLMNATPLGEDRGAVVSHTDISGARTPCAAYQNRTIFNTLLEETTDAVFLCNTTGRILLANTALANWLGKTSSEITGKKVTEIGPPEIGRLFLEQNAETIAAGKTRTFEITVATALGYRTFSLTKGLHYGAKGKLKGVFGIARDISEVKAMEREIIDTSDKEKQRLGQELHENLCQYLVGISLLGNVLYEELVRLNLKQAEDARQITGLVKEAVTEVRALAKGLAPMPLEQEEGLVSALQELAEQARAIGKIRCSLKVPRAANFVDSAAAIHLFRIAQEAVHNAIKHSQAKRLQITLSNSRRAVVLTVQDDGIGFNQDYPPDGDNSSGLGLHIMNYRSRAIGAELEIRKLPNRGTAVICTMPKPVSAG